MTEVVLAHESMRVLKRRVHVNRVRKWRHERDDLWIAFHKHYEASYYLDFESLGHLRTSAELDADEPAGETRESTDRITPPGTSDHDCLTDSM